MSGFYIDYSNRGRLCLLGKDRATFLHGQVTNNVKDLEAGRGCYAALADHKAKLQADLFIYNLGEELLLDFEPNLAEKVIARLEKFIIADDVQIVDASGAFGLMTLVGPEALALRPELKPFEIKLVGDSYYARTPRFGVDCIDVFYPRENPPSFPGFALAPENALETLRIENGVPRFGVDMLEGSLVPESLGENAISYSKGCYIGQEVIARIRTYGQVAKALRQLRFDAGAAVPKPGDKIEHDGKEVGHVTSAVFSPRFQRPVALGYVRKECNAPGTRVMVNGAVAEIAQL